MFVYICSRYSTMIYINIFSSNLIKSWPDHTDTDTHIFHLVATCMDRPKDRFSNIDKESIIKDVPYHGTFLEGFWNPWILHCKWNVCFK